MLRALALAVLALLVTALAASPARAQGFVNLAAAGGIDDKGAPTFDARVGLFSHIQLQAELAVAPLGSSHDESGSGSYTLAVGELGIMPYLELGNVGLAVHAAVGLGGLLAPTDASGARETKIAIVGELGPSLHFWPNRFLGFAVALDYRVVHVTQPFAGFPENSNDFVARLWIELALPGH